jgi:hypothetical protein
LNIQVGHRDADDDRNGEIVMTSESKCGSILIVDDQDELRVTLAYLLTECGFKVRQACDGFSALAEMKSETPDVLISDLNMPAMVRQRFPSIGVVAMSGAYYEDVVPTGVAADAFYAKGSRIPGSLLGKVKALMERGPLVRQRVETPIWIHRLPMGVDHHDGHLVCCPECRRMFSKRLEESSSWPHNARCPHCANEIQLAIIAFPDQPSSVQLQRQIIQWPN